MISRPSARPGKWAPPIVGTVELTAHPLTRSRGERRVDVSERRPFLLDQFDRAVDHVAEQHHPLLTVADDEHGAAGRVSRREDGVDARQNGPVGGERRQPIAERPDSGRQQLR